MSEESLVIVNASASGILGEYDHTLSFASEDDFVIIYGPNGVGKTKFLEIIDSLSRLDGYRIAKLPFESAVLHYSDASKLSVERILEPEQVDDTGLPEVLARFSLERPGQESITWNYHDPLAEELRKRTRFEQIGDELWRDPIDGEIVETVELRARYAPRFRGKRPEGSEVPSKLQKFAEQVPSFLIETQRLRARQLQRDATSSRYGLSRESRSARSKITEQAEQIRSLLNDAQTEHSRITQRLDRTFPNRVLQAARQDSRSDASSIRARYDHQNDFRSRLGRVASVALPEELALPDGDLEPWALALLDLYLEDAELKLHPFEDLLEKIELLETIINDRLLNKHLAVTDQDGLTVVHSDSQRSITLDSLSSGEQHEIILMIDLLFHVPKGAVVLIDEPEISLHVAWQLAFIPDVKRIAELVGFRFVVATHSPQIINDEWDRAVRLGPEEAIF
ncbi:AAA family ATPase [Micrococcus sp. TA1]|uniref:AAA family ATPase n=1 Tax=Micrococcus sp. TA1 TaxID=681627 RepID=UPI001608950B|nr:AAA family ATPase [Micrococcus sp. TA1]MBB5748036.1 putative ATP-binding protein involved in virulence [Micrococcus sp. TA1]